MEVPCVLLLEHVEEKMVNKARKFLSEKGFQEAPVDEPTNKKSKTEASPDKKTCSKPKAQRHSVKVVNLRKLKFKLRLSGIGKNLSRY